MNRLLITMVLGCLAGTQGCRRHDVPVGGYQPSRMTPADFCRDQPLRRLAEAVEQADEPAIAAAIQSGGDVNGHGTGGFPLLAWAMARGNVAGFELLLKHRASVAIDARAPAQMPPQSNRQSLLSLIIEHGDPRFLEAALRQGLDPNRVLDGGGNRSPLFLAVMHHADTAIELLLASGADIDWQDSSGYTPLIRAMMACSYNTARLLLDRGADPTIRDWQGHDVVWQLKKYGSRGVRPEHRESFEAIVAELIRRGLLTRQDIVEADRPKQPVSAGQPGITVIEHAPNSEAGRAIRELDRLEQESNRRNSR